MLVKMHGAPIDAWKPDRYTKSWLRNYHSADDQRVKKRKLEDNEETTRKQAIWKLV
jgi:hypothetical protein